MKKSLGIAASTFFTLATVGCAPSTEAVPPLSNYVQSQQCQKDTDCKGDRICESGRCTNPDGKTTDASQPLSRQPADTVAVRVPKFKDYPSGPLYLGATAALANKGSDYRTRFQYALQENDIVFASEYVIATIGCGTGCVFQTFLSKRTGQELQDGFGGEEGEKIKEVRTDSRLVVTAGKNDEDENDPAHYAYFYVLEGNRLRRIAKAKTQLPECEDMQGYCTIETPY